MLKLVFFIVKCIKNIYIFINNFEITKLMFTKWKFLLMTKHFSLFLQHLQFLVNNEITSYVTNRISLEKKSYTKSRLHSVLF